MRNLERLVTFVGGCVTAAGAVHYVWGKNRIENDERRINDTENALQELRNDLSDIQAQTDAWKSTCIDKFAEIDGRLTADEAVNDAQTQKIASLESDVELLQEEIVKIYETIDALRSQIPQTP